MGDDRSNGDSDHAFPTIDVQMIIGLFALGFGLYEWIGAGVLLIGGSAFLSVYKSERYNTDSKRGDGDA